MLDLGIKLLIAYMLGSVMGSLWVGRFSGGVDIRQEGSGNAGGTNALRTRGKGFALATIVIDVGKGLLAVLWVPGLALPGIATTSIAPAWVVVGCGAMAVVGHVWPLWHGLRGGKGAATLVGIIAVLQPWALIPTLGSWIAVLIFSGFVGLATVLAGFAAAISLILFAGGDLLAPTSVFGVVMALFVTWTHRSNLQRLRQGTEHRFEKAMLFRQR